MTKFIELNLRKNGPFLTVACTFISCGLAMGFTLGTFILKRNTSDFIRYCPLLMGIAAAWITSIFMVAIKSIKEEVVHCHYDLLIGATFFNILSSIFFFIPTYDIVGAFLLYFGQGITFVAGLSYLHTISAKETRSSFLSLGFVFYFLGTAIGATGIIQFHERVQENEITVIEINYIPFGISTIFITGILGALLIFMRLLHYFDKINFKIIYDEDLQHYNTIGKVFNGREEIIKYVCQTRQFFYVTKNKQFLLSFILIFSDTIYFGLFIYFLFWFCLNDAINMSIYNFSNLLWTITFGAILITSFLIYFSVKKLFISITILQIPFIFFGIILFSYTGTIILFWLVCLFFGCTIFQIKLSIIETSLFRLTEILIALIYTLTLLTIGLIYYYFVMNINENLLFKNTDQSILMAHGFILIIILSMVNIIIYLQLPKTYKKSLLDIKYKIMGIVFTEHNIEQLNMHYLDNGRIPTISTNM